MIVVYLIGRNVFLDFNTTRFHDSLAKISDLLTPRYMLIVHMYSPTISSVGYSSDLEYEHGSSSTAVGMAKIVHPLRKTKEKMKSKNHIICPEAFR